GRRFDRSRLVGLALVSPSLIYLTIFVFIPAIKAITTSFTVRDRDNAGNYSYRVGIDNYRTIFETETLRDNVVFTVLIAVISVAIVFGLAYSIALALRFGRGPVVRFLSRIYVIPLFIPSVIASYAMIT